MSKFPLSPSPRRLNNIIFFSRGGREEWVSKLHMPGQGGKGRLFVYWINTVICLSLDCHLNKVNVTWCTDDDDAVTAAAADDDDIIDEDDELSVNRGWQPTSCMFHCKIVSGQNVHCWGILVSWKLHHHHSHNKQSNHFKTPQWLLYPSETWTYR